MDTGHNLEPADVLEIHAVYAAYCHTIDHGDADGWADLFTEDAVWQRPASIDGDGSRQEGFTLLGREALRDFAAADYHDGRKGLARHWMGNVVLTGGPDAAVGHVYAFIVAWADGRLRLVAHGDFADRLVKTGDGWRIAERVAHLLPA
jgi:ketosteroid isomerase-like protein